MRWRVVAYYFYFVQFLCSIGEEKKMDNEKTMLDFFLEHADWLSVTNDNIPYEDMLVELDKNGVQFTEKRSYENKYVVIQKPYNNFINYMVGNSNLRITRFDLAFDINKDYMEVINKFIEEWSPHSCVGKKDRFETLYFNSRQSDMFCRLYDKQVESQLDFPLTRLEYEVKGVIAKIFSYRLIYQGVDDAMCYIINYIQDFNYHKNLLGLIKFSDIGHMEPVKFDIIEKSLKATRFRRFIRQYSNSLIDYCDYYNLTGNELLDLCTDRLNIERVIEGVS